MLLEELYQFVLFWVAWCCFSCTSLCIHLVFLLEKWSDVTFAPWQAELAPIYAELDIEDPAIRTVTMTTTLNRDDVRFVLYKVSRVKKEPIKCFALDLLASLRTGYTKHIWASDLCRSQK